MQMHQAACQFHTTSLTSLLSTPNQQGNNYNSPEPHVQTVCIVFLHRLFFFFQLYQEDAEHNLLACSWRGLLGQLNIFWDNHLQQNVKDIIEIPQKLHSPSLSELGWRSAIVVIVTVVLMGVVCLLDRGFAAAIACFVQKLHT